MLMLYRANRRLSICKLPPSCVVLIAIYIEFFHHISHFTFHLSPYPICRRNCNRCNLINQCYIPVSSVFQAACGALTYSIGSITFLFREIPTGYYTTSVGLALQAFGSNAIVPPSLFQMFIVNTAAPLSPPVALTGPQLTVSVNVCLDSLAPLPSILNISMNVSQLVPHAVFSLQIDKASISPIPVLDVFFETLPPFFSAAIYSNALLNPFSSLSWYNYSKGRVFLLFPYALATGNFTAGLFMWQVQTATANLICACSPRGGLTSFFLMNNGIASNVASTLSFPSITIVSASVVQNVPSQMFMGAALAAPFSVALAFRCSPCLFGAANPCACAPTLFATIENMNKTTTSCLDAVISPNTTDGFLAFSSPVCSASAIALAGA